MTSDTYLRLAMDVSALYRLDPLDAIAIVERVRAGDYRTVRRLGFLFAPETPVPIVIAALRSRSEGQAEAWLQTVEGARQAVRE